MSRILKPPPLQQSAHSSSKNTDNTFTVQNWARRPWQPETWQDSTPFSPSLTVHYFLRIWGNFHTKLHIEVGEQGRKVVWRKLKLQWANLAEIAAFCALSWSNVSRVSDQYPLRGPCRTKRTTESKFTTSNRCAMSLRASHLLVIAALTEPNCLNSCKNVFCAWTSQLEKSNR